MSATSIKDSAATAAMFAGLLLAAAGACRGRDASPPASDGASATATTPPSVPAAAAPSEPTTAIALPPGAWRTVGNDGHTLVSADTSTIAPLPGGEARLRLLYAFDAPQPVPGRPSLRYRTIVSQEQTDCAHGTSHPSVAVLYDEVGREVTRATSPAAGPRPPGLIGGVGPALCAYLKTRR